MIRPICRMGNPILRQKALKVSKDFFLSDDFSQLIQDMHDSMKHYGGIGIAAPQIGVSLQVALIELSNFNRYGEEVHLPLTIFVNPKIQPLCDETQGFWEGCLSVPGLRGYVERPSKIVVEYEDEKGNQKVLKAEGFLATVLQHELDHLNGTLYIDHVKNPQLISFQDEFEKYIQEKVID